MDLDHHAGGVAEAAARAPAAPAGERPTIVVVNRYPAAEVARAGLVLLAVLVGAYLLWRIQEVVVVLLLAILLATTIEPLVNRLRRGPFSRGGGVLIVYTGIIVVIGVPAYLAIPTLVAQSGAFMDSLPDRLQALRAQIGLLPSGIAQRVALGLVDQLAASLQTSSTPAGGQVVEVGATAAQTVIAFVSVFVLAFYWLMERAAIKRAVLRAVPTWRARDVNTIWLEIEDKLGGWVRGELILMVAIGVMSGLGYAVIGLPNPILLAVAAGLLEIVPMLGPVLASAPAVLVALTIDPTKALVVVGYAVVIQQLENNVLLPRVMRHTVGVSQLSVVLGLLIGAALYGLMGALLAVPVAGALQVILTHVLGTDDPPAHTR
jgi:predicted PurR-regulated permease PerM